MKIKILSWNIWCGSHLDEVIDFLRDLDADIIALQEVCEDERGNLAEVIAKKLGYECVHAIGMLLPVKFLPGYDNSDTGGMKFGNAILSKHKIINNNAITLTNKSQRLIIEANIEVGDSILNVYSIHLNHTHQTQSDLQDLQANNLALLANKPNTIVMGDFNALPDSSVIEKMSSVLKDVDEKKSTPTWCVYKEGCTVCLVDEVKYKLDYIFASSDIKSNSFKVHNSKGSDHLPISAIIEI
ncbi:endonuclease/exonuclease/phosphatase family protein [Candidatus Nomurabacteria bacterium]|nr:endonuclease/exonuclease/phosphatase family protein [Candidatus Nomurabacteria bacterium]